VRNGHRTERELAPRPFRESNDQGRARARICAFTAWGAVDASTLAAGLRGGWRGRTNGGEQKGCNFPFTHVIIDHDASVECACPRFISARQGRSEVTLVSAHFYAVSRTTALRRSMLSSASALPASTAHQSAPICPLLLTTPPRVGRLIFRSFAPSPGARYGPEASLSLVPGAFQTFYHRMVPASAIFVDGSRIFLLVGRKNPIIQFKSKQLSAQRGDSSPRDFVPFVIGNRGWPADS